jgi:hypothetical protein
MNTTDHSHQHQITAADIAAHNRREARLAAYAPSPEPAPEISQPKPAKTTRRLAIEVTGAMAHADSLREAQRNPAARIAPLVPKIRLSGRWLTAAGFAPGHGVHVSLSAFGVLTLTAETPTAFLA